MDTKRNRTPQMEATLAAQQEIKGMYRALYDATPGLERFERIKKALLWGIMGLVAVQKLIALFSISDASLPVVVLGLLMGLAIPGIVVLAIYRGPPKFSMGLYLWAALLLWDILANGLPLLTSGAQLIGLFYAMMVLQAGYCLYVFAVALWLTVPAKNRAFAQAINELYQASLQMMKQAGTKP